MKEKSPERRLASAVLKRAVLDISGSGDVKVLGPVALTELMSWVLLTSEDDSFSFSWCCEVVGLPRRKLATWFVQMARIRKVELPAEPWGVELVDGKVEAISRRLEKNLWRVLGGEGVRICDGEGS